MQLFFLLLSFSLTLSLSPSLSRLLPTSTLINRKHSYVVRCRPTCLAIARVERGFREERLHKQEDQEQRPEQHFGYENWRGLSGRDFLLETLC